MSRAHPCILSLFLAAPVLAQDLGDVDARPNLVVVFTDDQGWGDAACFGHPTIATPALDRIAREGQRWTQFYSGAPVCTPSRAALLTGREAVRNGMASLRRVVMFPDSVGGLPPDETTVAELLGGAGYATMCVGKWHLGHLPHALPTRHGFDRWYGLPYSNDMDGKEGWNARLSQPSEQYDQPLLRAEGDEVETVERPVQQETITRRYTDEAIAFVAEEREGPFFLYLAHSMPHVPLYRSPEFEGRSRAGIYGDVIEEIDHELGRLVRALEALDRPTVLLFTSDNGPWLPYGDRGGIAGPLRSGKGTTWEGGMRVPAIWWGPGLVEPGVVRELGSVLDVPRTFASLAGAAVPERVGTDGHDLSPVLRDPAAAGPRERVFYFGGDVLCAMREGPWKLHVVVDAPLTRNARRLERPVLFHLGRDPGERRDVAGAHPEVVESMLTAFRAYEEGVAPVENQLELR